VLSNVTGLSTSRPRRSTKTCFGWFDHDLRDRVVFQQRLQWAETDHVVEQRIDEVSVLELVQPQGVVAQIVVSDCGELGPHPLSVADVYVVGMPFDEHLVNGGLGFDQGLGGPLPGLDLACRLGSHRLSAFLFAASGRHDLQP